MAVSWPKTRRLLGTKISRIDAPAKATGTAKYSYDVNLPKMLHAAVLRCPHAHAKIKSLDTAAAMKMPGVKAVYVNNVRIDGEVAEVDAAKGVLQLRIGMTEDNYKQALKKWEDAADKAKADNKNPPPKPQAPEIRKIQLGPNDYVFRGIAMVKLGELKPKDLVTADIEADAVGHELFYAGEEIAAVAADTEEHAFDAIRAIKVEYDTSLPFLVREEDVLKNPDKKTVGGAGNSNAIPGGKESTKGNVTVGFLGSDAVVEGTYGVNVVCHQCLESHGLVAEWTADGGIRVFSSTQATVGTAGAIANRFKVPPTKVKCITQHMGGGYGSKFGGDSQDFAAVDLARRAGAPVKIMLTRADEITTAGNRPSAFGKVQIGGTKDGKITAFEIDCYGTSGFAGGATVNLGLFPYVYADTVPNIRRNHTVVRVNAGSARAMRAPNHPQTCTLTEFALDDLAAKLGIDPLVMRLANLPENDPVAIKKAPTSWPAVRNTIYNEQIKRAVELSKWKEKWHPPGQGAEKGPVKRGIGMALHTWGGYAAGGNQPNECKVIISRDGSVTVESSTQDLGTGARTVAAIIAAEVLGLEVKDIFVKIGESNLGFSTGSGGSTTLPTQGPATLRAAAAARDDLFAKVAKKVESDAKNLEIDVGKIVDPTKKKSWTWREFCAKLGMEEAKGTGEWSLALANEDPNNSLSNGQVGGVQVAEVVVDSETGVVKCEHLVAVQDCGLIVDLLTTQSQVAGGVIMGVNYALFEERIMDRQTGRQVNADMEFYKLGGLVDMPKITVEMVDMPERGVIGIGEPPTISTGAAIGNAVFNALGVRVPMLPLTPERVLDAIAKGGKSA
jgi:xanthine dehydrogenase YagR molybdenum-binding subunit